ncbi:MAG: iron transporter [Sphingobium sp.]
MAARILTAFAGGYAATSGVAALTARILPISRVEATAWAMSLSFLLYAGLLLWAFHERRLVRVAALIWGVAALSAGAAWLLGTRP